VPPSSPATGGGFNADTPLFTDDFSDTSVWGTAEFEDGSIRYEAGSLVLAFTQDDSSFWSWRDVDAPWATMRVAGRVFLTGEVAGGWGCGQGVGTEGSPAIDIVGGTVTSDDRWEIFSTIGGSTTILEEGDLPDTIVATSPYRVHVECAGTDTGAIRVRLQIDGVEVGTYEQAEGPSSFDAVAAFASAIEPDSNASLDDVEAFGGTSFTGFPVPNQAEVDALLAHVPDAFHPTCSPQAPDREGMLAGVICEPAGSAFSAVYASYADNQVMNQHFVELAEDLDSPEGGTCQTGPNVGPWSVEGGAQVGTLTCGPNPDDEGIVFLWTHDELNILTGGRFATEDYGAMYTWWANEAGPLP
jgi:hypothetical protein